MRRASKRCVLACAVEALAVEAVHPWEVVDPYLLVDELHSYWDLSGYPVSTQQGRLVELEDERGLSGDGSEEERS
jgi:hypothetical protein